MMMPKYIIILDDAMKKNMHFTSNNTIKQSIGDDWNLLISNLNNGLKFLLWNVVLFLL